LTRDNKTNGIQSVERALATLEVFLDQSTPLSVTEVAALTEGAPATVHRLLQTLVRGGWLEQDPRSLRYDLSVKMLTSSALALGGSRLLRDSRHSLTQLAEATGLNSFLTAPTRRGSVLLAKAQGRDGGTADFQVGRIHPLHGSATGKLFLAFLPYEEWWSRAEAELKKLTSSTIVDQEALRTELETIRDRGYATDHDELYDSYRSIAVPVRGNDSRVVAALSCSGWASQLPDAFEPVVLRELIPAARELSQILGDSQPW
jgi:IclR family acetate operon transcriptional repressor